MLTIHHLSNSRSLRAVWLCEELGVAYAIVRHQRDPQTQRSPDSLRQVHPLGKAPAIEHDGKVIVESEAVIDYICQRIAGGRLSRDAAAADFGAYRQWLAFSEGTLMPALVFDLVYAWTGGGNPALKGFFDAEIDGNLAHLAAMVGDREGVLASGFSAADVCLGWTLEWAECRGRLAAYGSLQRYLAALRGRPAYSRALTAAGGQDLSVFGPAA